MTKSAGSPSDGKFSPFRCEKGIISNVTRGSYTVTLETDHGARNPQDVQIMAPYHHYENGEGIHHLPEVGAICYLAFPNDNTPPFVLGYIGAPAAVSSSDGDPVRSTPDGTGSMTDVSFRSKRPKLNPGDIAITTRDNNFLYLLRGGVVQIGATPLAQRIYLPILNYIKDFCENYEMHTFGGDVAWTVARQEDDPSGDAPATYTFHLNEFAQDRKATVRVRHLPLRSPGSEDKAAWEISVAPQNIDRDTGAVSDPVYTLVVTTSGKKTELVGANRSVTVRGDDELTVNGKQTLTVSGKAKLSAGEIEYVASGTAVVGGSQTKIGGATAASPSVKGEKLLEWFASAQFTGPSGTVTVDPASLARLAQILSDSVFIK